MYGPTGRPISVVWVLPIIIILIYLLFILPRRRLKHGKVSRSIQRLRIAYIFIFINGGSGVIIGLVNAFFYYEVALGLPTVGNGIASLILGYFVMKRSSIALGIAIGLSVFHMFFITTFLPHFVSGTPVTFETPPLLTLAALGLYVFLLGRAFEAIRDLKQEEKLTSDSINSQEG